ncbi:MAG: RNA polymerase sigma factor [Burkholderiales bacterium]
MPSDIADALVGMLPRLRRYAMTLCKAREAADDLVQSACGRALATNADRDDGAPFDAWMFRIVRNLWIDGFRKAKTEGSSENIDEHGEIAGSDGRSDMESRLTLARVWQCIDLLPADQREVLLLVCVEEFSYKDAADVLGVPVGTVMSRLARARLKLVEMTGGARG